MAFSIERIEENGFRLLRLKDTTGSAIVDILPEFGALLHRFQVPVQGIPFNLIDQYPDRNTLDRELARSFKSAKLSPFVCRIKQGRYEWQGKPYTFQRKFPDGSAIHGLLFNQSFSETANDCDETKASVSLQHHYRQDDPGFPFEYSCEIRYTLLTGHELELTTTVRNLSASTMPLADGWHPYFRLGGKIDSYLLGFRSQQMLEFNDALLPTGQMIGISNFRQPHVLGNRSLDNCFLLEEAGTEPCCTLENPHNGLRLSIFTDASYPYLQIFTPPHRESIALENLSGAPDCFNNHIGIHLLAPQQALVFSTRYRIDTRKND